MSTTILVATAAGCRVFTEAQEDPVELAGRGIYALSPAEGRACLAIVEGNEVWHRAADGGWTLLAHTPIPMGSLLSLGSDIYLGAMAEARLLRLPSGGALEYLDGLEQTSGRTDWFANGPPLHVRSLAATIYPEVILAAIHVGGIARSQDNGRNWHPTIPVSYDVHEVRAHLTSPLVAAACAVGLAVSLDGGESWSLVGGEESLAVALLPDQVLFSVQKGGAFAERSQIWSWPIEGGVAAPVTAGLPDFLEGKIDTGHLSANAQGAAVVDGGGNLWVSQAWPPGSRWECWAEKIPNAYGVLLL